MKKRMVTIYGGRCGDCGDQPRVMDTARGKPKEFPVRVPAAWVKSPSGGSVYLCGMCRSENLLFDLGPNPYEARS